MSRLMEVKKNLNIILLSYWVFETKVDFSLYLQRQVERFKVKKVLLVALGGGCDN